MCLRAGSCESSWVLAGVSPGLGLGLGCWLEYHRGWGKAKCVIVAQIRIVRVCTVPWNRIQFQRGMSLLTLTLTLTVYSSSSSSRSSQPSQTAQKFLQKFAKKFRNKVLATKVNFFGGPTQKKCHFFRVRIGG